MAVILIMNSEAQYFYEHKWMFRAMTVFNIFMVYAFLGFSLLEVYLNAKGRTLNEIIVECVDGPAVPRFTVGATWGENLYLCVGCYRVLPVMIFPYFFGTPLSGIEYCYMESQIKQQPGIWEEFLEGISNYFISND